MNDDVKKEDKKEDLGENLVESLSDAAEFEKGNKKLETKVRKKDSRALKQKIKEAEDKKRVEAIKKANLVPRKIEFDVWYAMRQRQIPKHHRREIIRADFMARGMPNEALKAEYDEALQVYGIKLTE